MLQVFSFISLAPAMKQGIVPAFKQMFVNVADKKVHWLNILFLIDGGCLVYSSQRMTQNITKIIIEEEKMMLETAALFISSCYAPWALNYYMVAKALSNDLSATKSDFPYQGSLPKARAGSACQHAAPFL
jgi:hypothetical protein